MKLSVDIIYQDLKQMLPVTLLGKDDTFLSLSRPEFYLDKSAVFKDGHVYICSADHLPDEPVIEGSPVLICLGTSLQLERFRDRCNILSIPETENIFSVFNRVQDVFNKYETWEERIGDILRGNASLVEMLEQSKNIFQNPMLLTGADFNYLAYTDKEYLEKNTGIRFDTPSFDPDLMATFLSMHEIATDIKEPLLFDLMGWRTLSVNIFNEEEYLGCITIYEKFRDFYPSDTVLCLYFSHMLKQAIERTPALAGERSALRSALRDIIDGHPADPEQRRMISRQNHMGTCFCAVLRSSNESAPLPPGYVASVIEQQFLHALAFEHRQEIVAVFPAASANHLPERSLIEHLQSFLTANGMLCGISAPFTDLYDIDHVCFQASAALGNANRLRKAGLLFFFEDCILPQLLHSAAGNIPTRFYYTAGLDRLKKHDTASQVSYIDTLKTYLECNMSIAQTAKKLILHRSSLIDRLSRIQQILGDDLSDADTRLLLQLILRIEQLQVEEK